MGGGYWVTRTVVSGKVTERSKFFHGRRRPRAKRKGSTSLAQKDRNMNTAVRQLARGLNCNVEASWIFLTLTYEDEHLPKTAEDAWKEVTLFIRRLKRRGIDVKGFWITADKSKDGDPARLHHHMVIEGSGIAIQKTIDKSMAVIEGGDALQGIWGRGFVYAEPVEDQIDRTPLAAYLVRQAEDEPGKKKWRCSTGMKKPVVVSEVITDRAGELHVPPGAEVMEIGHYDEETGSQYVRYIPAERKPKDTQHIGFSWAEGPYARKWLEES